MNIWHDMSPENVTTKSFYAVIEITKGSKIKYELDKKSGMLKLDRVLFTSTHYPANYGFIPRTYSQDNDPLDVLVLCQDCLEPMSIVECYPIGVLKMLDNNEVDEKIIAIPLGDPSLNTYNDLDELPVHQFHEIKHFFEVYKFLENKVTVVEEICDRKEAERIIIENIERYNSKFGGIL